MWDVDGPALGDLVDVYYFPPSLTPLEPQSRFGDKVLEIRVNCPQNGTAVLKGLSRRVALLNSSVRRFSIVFRRFWVGVHDLWKEMD